MCALKSKFIQVQTINYTVLTTDHSTSPHIQISSPKNPIIPKPTPKNSSISTMRTNCCYNLLKCNSNRKPSQFLASNTPETTKKATKLLHRIKYTKNPKSRPKQFLNILLLALKHRAHCESVWPERSPQTGGWCKAESNKFPMCDAQISLKNSACKKATAKTTEKHFKIHFKWIPHKKHLKTFFQTLNTTKASLTQWNWARSVRQQHQQVRFNGQPAARTNKF